MAWVVTTDAVSLGTSALNFSDLFLDSEAVINWDSGDVTLAHAANKLTFGGAALEIDFANHEMTNVDIDSGAIDGTAIGAASESSGKFSTIIATGIVSIDDTTESTSTTTGSLHTDGGMGVAKDLVLGATSQLFIGETSNAGQTTGLTINQGTATNQSIALKFAGGDSGFGHPMTAIAEADTFGALRPNNSLEGGFTMRGYADAIDSGAIVLEGMLGATADTGKTAGDFGVVRINARETDGGNSVQAVAADGNLVSIDTGGTTRFIFDTEGSAHADVEWTTFDKEDDLEVISGIEAAFLGQVPVEKRLMYEDLGVVGRGSWHVERGKLRAMVNTNKLAMLHHGAFMQVGTRLQDIEDRLLAAGA